MYKKSNQQKNRQWRVSAALCLCLHWVSGAVCDINITGSDGWLIFAQGLRVWRERERTPFVAHNEATQTYIYYIYVQCSLSLSLVPRHVQKMNEEKSGTAPICISSLYPGHIQSVSLGPFKSQTCMQRRKKLFTPRNQHTQSQLCACARSYYLLYLPLGDVNTKWCRETHELTWYSYF